MVLRSDEGKVLAVLDTKYKAPPEPSSEDLQQVVAYAVRMGTGKAFLLYPRASTPGHRLRIGGVQVYSLGFALGGPLEDAGRMALDGILKGINGA